MQKIVMPAECAVHPGLPASFAASFVALFASLLAASVFFLPPQSALAQETPEDDRLTILITASRFAETVDETLAPVTVITRKEIEEKQAATVEEVLRTVPGVTLSNNGGAGKLTTLFLRGTESNHVLALIDGVKVGSASSGLTQFEHLPLDQIEKIEVVRGPRSSLYGSEAIGGVIQIFTRKGKGKTRPRLSIGTGSHNTKKLSLGASGGTEDAWYNVGASTLSTDGYNACRGDADTFAGCGTVEPDDDGYDNDSFSLRGGASLTDRLTVEGNLLNSNSDSEFDGGYSNEVEHIARVASVKATLQATGRWQSSLLVGWSKDEAENFKDGTHRSMAETTRDQINWQNNIMVGENSTVITGIDYLDDKTDSAGFSAYDVNRNNTGVFALLRTEINANDLELSLRNDDDEQFGDHNTGSVGWGRNLGDGKRITASYGTAFKAPTFGELYGFGGNPDLDPETSRSVDFGFSHSGSNVRWRINLFDTKIDDLVDYRADKNLNIEEAKIAGIEFTADTTLGEWNASGTLTWQDAEDRSAGNKGEPLLRRPQKKLDLDFSRRFGKHRFGINIYAQGESKDFGGSNLPPADLPGFATVNLRGEMRLEPNWSFGLKVNNLLDKAHETAYLYPQDGLNFMMTLRYVPDGR